MCKLRATEMRFTIHTGLKITPFEVHHGRKPRTELTNIVENGKTYLFTRSEMTKSAPNRPKKQLYKGRDAEGEITNHVMARTKTEKKHLNEDPKSPEKKILVRYLLYFFEKNYNKNHKTESFKTKNHKLQSAELRVP